MYNYGKCHVRGEQMEEKEISQEFWIKGKLIVIEGVPVGVCPQCGERVVKADVGQHDAALWSNVPERVWDYTIGGYQVIKKWLSYREHEILGRGLTSDEAREVMQTARRIAAILLLETRLDENYGLVKAECYDWK